MRLPSGERVGAPSFPVEVTCLCAGAGLAGTVSCRSRRSRVAYTSTPTIRTAHPTTAAVHLEPPVIAGGKGVYGSWRCSVTGAIKRYPRFGTVSIYFWPEGLSPNAFLSTETLRL